MVIEEALAQFAHAVGTALIELAEALDGRPRAAVVELVAPDSPTARRATGGVESGVLARSEAPTPTQVGAWVGEVRPDDHQCPDCGLIFGSLVGVGVHRARKHGVPGASRQPAAVELTCPDCGHESPTPQAAGKHARWCGSAPPTEAAGRSRAWRKGDRKPVDCPHCGRTCRSAAGASRHIPTCALKGAAGGLASSEPERSSSATNAVEVSPPMLPCESGQASVDPSSGVENPVLPRRPTSEDLDPLDPGRVVYVCPDCDTVHAEKINANAHRRMHRHGEPERRTVSARAGVAP